MANIEVTDVSFVDSWAPDSLQSVDVKIDNHEAVGPVGWGPVACPDSGLVNDGHMTDVTLRIRSSQGIVVWEGTKGQCVPVERPSTSLGPNATVSFEPRIATPGEYTVQAEVQVRGDNGNDTSDLYPLVVEDSGATVPPQGDDRDAGLLPGAEAPDLSQAGPDWMDEAAWLVAALIVVVMLGQLFDVEIPAGGATS